MEGLSEARTPLADYFSSLLQLSPKGRTREWPSTRHHPDAIHNEAHVPDSLQERPDGDDNSSREELIVKIAQIAPLWKSAPHSGASDPERTLSYLTDELVRRGHEVTLFASADSHASAGLEALGETPFCRAPAHWGRPGETTLADELAFETCADEFDIIRSHVGIHGFPMARRCTTPTLTTLQERLDLPEYVAVFEQFQDLPLVSTSDAQRRPVAWASWQQTIYPGVPSERYRVNLRTGKYLAFLGSLSLEGGLGLAIELSKRAHLPLRVASRPGSTGGFPLSIPMELMMADHGIEWVGELSEEEKNDFLGEALASVCTQDECSGSSGLCVVEALACGTPVLAFQGENAAEMMYDHVTGFACESLNEMVDVLPLVGDLDRRECRGAFEKRFSAERMADQYLRLYERLIGAAKSPRVSGAAVIQRAQTDRQPMMAWS